MSKSLVTSLTCVLSLTLAESKVNPVIDPNFQVSLVEVDANNVTILEETLAWDIDLRRSHMYAEGSLVHGLVIHSILIFKIDSVNYRCQKYFTSDVCHFHPPHIHLIVLL
jgi:hypothetical protein